MLSKLGTSCCLFTLKPSNRRFWRRLIDVGMRLAKSTKLATIALGNAQIILIKCPYCVQMQESLLCHTSQFCRHSICSCEFSCCLFFNSFWCPYSLISSSRSTEYSRFARPCVVVDGRANHLKLCGMTREELFCMLSSGHLLPFQSIERSAVEAVQAVDSRP